MYKCFKVSCGPTAGDFVVLALNAEDAVRASALRLKAAGVSLPRSFKVADAIVPDGGTVIHAAVFGPKYGVWL